MNQQHDRKPPAGANWIWVMGGCYLLYLAVSMLMRVYDGTTEMVGMSIVGAVVFIVCGIGMIWREWRNDRRAKEERRRRRLEEADDPEAEEADGEADEAPEAFKDEEEER